MEKAYIVLAHKAPQQLCRLIESLSDGSSHFFIHVDRSCDQRQFKRELENLRNWQFVKSEDGAWGQFGIVKATLNGLRNIVEVGKAFDVVSLISGQDYPVRSNSYITRFFQANAGKIFIEYFPLPAEFLYNGGLDRIHNYHFGDRRLGRWQRISRIATRLSEASNLFRRKVPRGLRPYGGWQWWSMPIHAVKVILRFLNDFPEFASYHRFSLLPDEMFFQTILLNVESEEIRSNLVNNCLRFIDWDNPNPATPATLTNEYYDALVASKSLFARKFDVDQDVEILNKLDAYRAEEDVRLKAEIRARKMIDVSRSVDFPHSPAALGTKSSRQCSKTTEAMPVNASRAQSTLKT